MPATLARSPTRFSRIGTTLDIDCLRVFQA
jgi:hypothetical protein